MFKALLVISFMGLQLSSFCADSVPQFSAVYDGRKNVVKIKWQDKISGAKTFIIQRSADNIKWIDIGLQAINNNTSGKSFEDKNPAAGENYYRLKYFTNDDNATFTLSIMVIIGQVSNNWVMYPVPVRDVLTLQYNGTETIKGVITVLIQPVSGKIITRVRSGSLSKLIQIPVSNLGAGIYDVRIIVEDEIIWNQRFIK